MNLTVILVRSLNVHDTMTINWTEEIKKYSGNCPPRHTDTQIDFCPLNSDTNLGIQEFGNRGMG